MSEAVAVMSRSPDERGRDGWLHWHCPGCDCTHALRIDRHHPNRLWWMNQGGERPTWKWNGSLTRPTIRPSVNMPGVCHCVIRKGSVHFCRDSKHSLAGKTVPLPAWE